MADSQKYGRTANLFDGEIESGFYNDNGELVPDSTTSHSTTYIPVDGTTYTISGLWTAPTAATNFAVYEWDTNKNWLRRSNRQVPASSTLTFSIGSDTAFFTLQIKAEHDSIMLNTGSTALPYQPYLTWQHSLRKLTTATEAVENPLYSDGTAITAYTIKGNTVQNGTGTPDSPVMPEGCGDLEATGEHAGQYKIPISSGGVTTNIYLGSTQTTRQIKKLVLTGQENWVLSSYANVFYTADYTDYLRELDTNLSLCSHYRTIGQVLGASFISDGVMSWYGRTNASRLYIGDVSFSTAAELQAYLQQQYTVGTPITVWYVLENETTGIVNEPLMKIGDYADTLSNAASIPTTEGANSITVDTTVQPSEFTATWTGWHDSSVKEWDGSQWNE